MKMFYQIANDVSLINLPIKHILIDEITIFYKTLVTVTISKK